MHWPVLTAAARRALTDSLLRRCCGRLLCWWAAMPGATDWVCVLHLTECQAACSAELQRLPPRNIIRVVQAAWPLAAASKAWKVWDRQARGPVLCAAGSTVVLAKS